MAVELYTLVRLGLTEFGVTPAEHDRAIRRSRTLKVAPRVSGPLLKDARGLGVLLLEWSREAPYLDARGEPRVLAIRGPGATFEGLCRQFLPHRRVEDVVSMACATAEVAVRPGGTIALLGSVLVKIVKSTELLLAHSTRQIDLLLGTVLHNAHADRTGRQKGRMERMVIGVIPQSEFDDLMQEWRPQIDDLLQRVDSSVQQRQPKTPRSIRNATAVSVSIYVSQDNDWERAGIDAASLVKPVRRRRKRRKPR